MKILFFLIFACFLCSSFSCKPKTIKTSEIKWYALSITSEDHTVITVWPNNDTVTVKIYNNGTIFYRPKKVTTDTLRFIFTKSERDSLFVLANDIISTPPKYNHRFTDFVGDLQLVTYYEPTIKKSIDYSGVCNWNTLSDKTMQLHDLLKRRMKKVFLGENDGGRSHTGR